MIIYNNLVKFAVDIIDSITSKLLSDVKSDVNNVNKAQILYFLAKNREKFRLSEDIVKEYISKKYRKYVKLIPLFKKIVTGNEDFLKSLISKFVIDVSKKLVEKDIQYALIFMNDNVSREVLEWITENIVIIINALLEYNNF